MEVDVKNDTRSKLMVLACVSLSLAMTVCGSDGSATDEPTKEPKVMEDPAIQEILITVTEQDGKVTWKNVPPVRVHTGDSIDFKVKIGSAWILIPDGQIESTAGGREWARAKGLLAFELGEDGATVTVPEDYQMDGDEVVITYSIMARADIDGASGWGYVHGENPPPRIIIRKR
jgi:hypothetical protein